MIINIYRLIIFALLVHCTSVISEPILKSEENIALNGYDAVSYFREKLAVKGDETIKTEYSNSTWYFRDSSNLKTFLKNPSRFVPQYGGFCAFGTRYGMLIESDPQVFAIVNRKLYFNLDTGVRNKWRRDLVENIEKADKKWEKLKLKDDPKIKKREIELASE